MWAVKKNCVIEMWIDMYSMYQKLYNKDKSIMKKEATMTLKATVPGNDISSIGLGASLL